MQIIFPKLEDDFSLYVAIEYSADNELSIKLLEGITESIVHFECNDGEYTNSVTVDIKEK